MTEEDQILSAEEEAQARIQAEKQPKATPPRARLALHCWRTGQLQEALEWVDSCLEIDDTVVGFYRIRANVLAEQKQTSDAVETALKAIEIAPESVIARLLTVRMYLADLQPAKAQETLDAALELDPRRQHLQLMKPLQAQVVNMLREAEHRPLDWYSRKLKKRLAGVAAENQPTT